MRLRSSAAALAAVIGSTTGLALAGPAVAGTPASGCWVGPGGLCNDVVGPFHGRLVVADGKVSGVGDDMACLGSARVAVPGGGRARLKDALVVTHPLTIRPNGTFSFTGRAERTAAAHTLSGAALRPVEVRLSGRFTHGGRDATLTLDVRYRSCRPITLALHRSSR